MKFRSLIMILFFIPGHQYLQSSPSPLSLPQNPYDHLWKQADSLEKKGLPQSTLDVISTIYQRAKKEKNDPQLIKSIIYRIKVRSEFEENVLPSEIKSVKAEIIGAKEPSREILSSVLAELYWRYYEDNRFRFDNRSAVLNNKTDSIETWDLNTLSKQILKTYMLSLENPELLKGILIGNFREILDTGAVSTNSPVKNPRNKNIDGSYGYSVKFRPTLFDFLAWRALDYFTGGAGPLIVGAGNFKIDKPFYFSQAGPFYTMKDLIPDDSLSPENFAVKIYCTLAGFHRDDKDPAALIDEELRRFAYFRQQASLEIKDSLYFDALKKLEQKYLDFPGSADVSFVIASSLIDNAQLYKPLESIDHKWDIRDADIYCKEAVKRFPESDGGKNCQNLGKKIREPYIQLKTEYGVIPSRPFPGLIEFRNISTLYFRLVKSDPESLREKLLTGIRQEDIRNWLVSLSPVKSWSQNLPSDGDFQVHRIEIKIPAIPEGFYILICSNDTNFKDTRHIFSWSQLFSTNISYISIQNEKKGLDIYILDRETGKPLQNVKADAFARNYDYQQRKYIAVNAGSFISDDNGFFRIPPIGEGSKYPNIYFRLKNKEDLFFSEDFFRYPPPKNIDKPVLQTFFFTDRAIFRPGQIIYFKGIILEKTGDNSAIKSSFKTTVTFTDVNSQKISEKEFITNEFGSFNGSFVAPQGVLTGMMTISNGSGSVTVSVEEYKRPTFEVTFDPLEGNYRLDDTINVTGKAVAFAGNNIDRASGKYRVVRIARFPFWDRWWLPFPTAPEVEITNGIIKTDANGKFMIRFRALPDKTIDRKINPVFNYSITADVTDISGENQSASETVSVGYLSLLLGLDITGKVNLTKDSIFNLTTTNLNGRKTTANVDVTFQRLQHPDHLFRKRLWDQPDLAGFSRDDFYKDFPNDIFMEDDKPDKWPVGETIFKKTLNTATDSAIRLSLFAIKKGNGEWILNSGTPLNQGYYSIILKTKDPNGEEVITKKYFIVFNPMAKELPVNEINWFYPLMTEAKPGETVKFIVGSKEKNVKVIFEIRKKDSLISRHWMDLDANQKIIEVPVKEDYRGNFAVNFVFIRHNRSFLNSQVITVPYANKKLDITFATFRNKLLPGQNEEWKIKITDASKKGVDAEFLTAMYDASLDQFRPNSWDFSLYRSVYYPEPWNTSSAFRIAPAIFYPVDNGGYNFISKEYYQLNWFGFTYYHQHWYYKSVGGMNRDHPMAMDEEAKVSLPVTAESVQNKEVVVQSPSPASNEGMQRPGENKPTPVNSIRRDLRETAFFYPSLVADSSGNLDVRFTVPESLTKWRIMGFAHTKNLDFGKVENELITQKDLMVFPNAPRFVRQGDTVVFSAKVVNVSNRTLSGDISLELLNGISLKPLSIIVGSQQLNFIILNGQSESFSWKMIIPNDPALSLLQYRIVAKSGSFSDGEEKAFPVLADKILVTESMPLPLRGKGSFDFLFRKLIDSKNSSSLSNYNLTLEFTSNPAWYAIQALPLLDEPVYPSADNIFNAFYANSIASFIANSDPLIKKVFESWKSITPDALLSNLEKNQSLKSALLQETPWVLEAKSESERKQRVGIFFDLNILSNRLEQNLQKLQKLQKPGGGWSWFEGMEENRYITQNIVTGLGRLDHLGIRDIRNDEITWNMTRKAIAYLDEQIAKDYEYIKKYWPDNMDDDHIGPAQIQYLYARSYFQDMQIPDARCLIAFEYFKKQCEKFWLKNEIYFQGMIALALNRLGNHDIPKIILKSLSEKALHSPEMGMYWAILGGYEWYKAPVETEALLIEAYDEVNADLNSVDEMKIWLLKQKQTQDWSTSRATAEACYALLLRGTDLLTKNPDINIQVGTENIEPSKLQNTKVEAGTGYFQVSWPGTEISPEMGKIKVKKSEEGVSWGALYWQYFEDLDKITPAQTPLKIDKKLYLERNTPTGPVLEEITNYELRLPAGQAGITGDTLSKKFTNSPIHQFTNFLTIGDILKVRIILTVDRTLEFVHLKDMRASAFEPFLTSSPVHQFTSSSAGEGLSGYRYQDGLGYYQSTTDVATNFFFDYLPKGTYVFEYPLVVNAAGNYSNGIATIQCMYAPEFTAHSDGIRVVIR